MPLTLKDVQLDGWDTAPPELAAAARVLAMGATTRVYGVNVPTDPEQGLAVVLVVPGATIPILHALEAFVSSFNRVETKA